MRQAGTLPGEQQAERFADYLLTLGITTRLEKQGDAWAVWVREEERVPQAKEELAAFARNPTDPRFSEAETKARTIRREVAEKEEQARKNIVELRGRWSTPGGRQPLTMILIGVSLLVAVATGIGEEGGELQSQLSIAAQAPQAAGPQPFLPEVRQGEVWRLVTPIFLHFGVAHLLFNMLMLYRLGGLIESSRGQVKLALLVLSAAAFSNVAEYFWQYFRPDPANFGGMSGVLYAMAGYAWMKSRFDPTVNIYLPPDTVMFLVLWLFICMTGAVGPIANVAHVAGFVFGIVTGYAPIARRRMGKD
jgi:GlpG protein